MAHTIPAAQNSAFFEEIVRKLRSVRGGVRDRAVTASDSVRV
jgi:hypothetical protein